MLQIGRKLFNNIGFIGIGSAEFKRDERDGKLKLIEINPRYWQQNLLALSCNVNFPYINYLDLIDKRPEPITNFKAGIKWVNFFSDFNSFMSYRKLKQITFVDWLKSLKGSKIFSNFSWDDLLPLFKEINFGLRIFKAPIYFTKKFFNKI